MESSETSMDAAAIGRLALSWIQLQRAARGSQEQEREFWSFETVWEMCQDDAAAAWQVILQIHARRPGEIVLANLAAGPVEDLLVHHGHTVLPWIERYCADAPDFVQVLEMVWRNDIAEEVWHRLQRLTGSRRR